MSGSQLNLLLADSSIKDFGIRIPVLFKLGEQVSTIKNKIIDTYGDLPLVKSRPHITLANLRTSTSNLRRLKDVLSHLEKIERFNIQIDGVTCFDTAGFYTILLKIVKIPSLVRIQNTIREGARHLVSSRNSVYPSSPHITITRCKFSQVEEIMDIIKSHRFE